MAFAAVSSVARILDRILQHQCFVLENRPEVESLFKEITSLKTFLEHSSQKNSENIPSFEGQIMDAAYIARDLIEFHIKAQIIQNNNLIFSSHKLLYEAKQEVDFIEQRLMKAAEDGGVIENVHPMISPPDLKLDKVCLCGDTEEILWMTKGPSWLEATFIVGVAGIGKTTQARIVFYNSYVMGEFEIRAWVTVSQCSDVREILIDILDSMRILPQEIHEITTLQLQESLHQSLKNTQYLIVLDDLRDTQVFDDLYRILPDNKNESRILVTTRLQNVSVCAKHFHLHHMTIFQQIRCRQGLIERSRPGAEYLLKKVRLLREILEDSSKQIKSLENHIINAERKVKDFMECCVNFDLTFSPQCLMEIKGVIDLAKKHAQDLHYPPGAGSSTPTAMTSNINVVGLHRDLTVIKNKLAEQSSKLEVVSLVGMGGIGKTTLAKEVYNDKFFSESFPIRAWVTVSQSYEFEEVLYRLLDSMKMLDYKRTTEDLSHCLYKKLKGWKYLIVIDDVWDTKVWDDLRRIFPDDKCSSRILLTTRLEKVAKYTKSYLHHVNFLNKDASWNLFCNKVFGEDSCPPQVEEIGKMIVRKCRGLPLAITVIGGLLYRATTTQDYWRNVAENLSSSIISNEDDHCSKILSLSYTHLPDHLKKCFLYTGIFSENSNIQVSKLVKLWVAEGFLEALDSNRLMEDIAYESLSDLVSRSLLMIVEESSTGKIKTCKIHDVVREFCTIEAKTKMLLHISDISLYGIPAHASVPLRLSIHQYSRSNIFPCDDKKLSSLEVTTIHIVDPNFRHSLHHLNPEPLRVFDMEPRRHDNTIIEETLNKLLSYNLRYLSFHLDYYRQHVANIYTVLPDLQTLIASSYWGEREFAIWNMPQLRHAKAQYLCLPDPIEGENSSIVLQSLQTLSQVSNFRFSKEAVRRFPNLRRLRIVYTVSELQDYCLENIVYLHKLESLTCASRSSSLLHVLKFPNSLKKLTLVGSCLPWKDMAILASSLPNLEVLKLKYKSFKGKEWESSSEDEFPKLKYLLLDDLDLELWRGDSVNFPSLQRLIIRHCRRLAEIPRCIVELPRLQLIELVYCGESVVDLIKEMQEEQEDFGNDYLQFRIIHW